MKKFVCESDIGSVLVGNKQVRFALPNIGGDGLTTVIICDSNSEYLLNVEEDSNVFTTVIEGTFNVFSYDCSDGRKEDIVTTLTGRYGVYRDSWKVILVKWE